MPLHRLLRDMELSGYFLIGQIFLPAFPEYFTAFIRQKRHRFFYQMMKFLQLQFRIIVLHNLHTLHFFQINRNLLVPDIGNAGSMRNQGIEAGITVIPVQTKDFQWTTSMNYSTNKNELLSLSNDQFVSSGYSDQGSTGEPLQTTTHRIQEGQPIGNFWGYKSIDIDENGHWIIEGADGSPKPISQLQPTDKQIIGNGLPKHYLNWNNTLNWKNFDFNMTMRGAFGFDILNMPRLQYESPVMLSRGNVLNAAFDTKYGKVPLAADQELQYVSYYIEKGNYWKIDNVTLGYTFKFNSWIKRLRIYGTISNLATITGYSGIDPEVSISGLAPGVDNKNRYPSTRTYTLGISVKF